MSVVLCLFLFLFVLQDIRFVVGTRLLGMYYFDSGRMDGFLGWGRRWGYYRHVYGISGVIGLCSSFGRYMRGCMAYGMHIYFHLSNRANYAECMSVFISWIIVMSTGERCIGSMLWSWFGGAFYSCHTSCLYGYTLSSLEGQGPG